MTQEELREKDLIVLVADNNMEAAFLGLLARHQSLSTRPLTWNVLVYRGGNDPRCLREAHEFLRSQTRLYRHALVVFDRKGCGSSDSAADLEAAVRRRLSAAGWADRAACVVIDPELEAWVWSTSPHVASVLGWRGRRPDLRAWLAERGFFTDEENCVKPRRPKEALKHALREARKIRSSAIYLELASKVGLEACTDASFMRLKTILQDWFPASPEDAAGEQMHDRTPAGPGE